MFDFGLDVAADSEVDFLDFLDTLVYVVDKVVVVVVNTMLFLTQNMC